MMARLLVRVLLKIDTINKTSKYYGNISTLDGVGQVAADDTYIYLSTNKYGAGDLIRINRSNSEVSTLKNNINYTLFQRKNGVVFKDNIIQKWHYLFNGAIVDGEEDLNQNVPWGSDNTDLYTSSNFNDLPNSTPDDWAEGLWDTSTMVPVNGKNRGYFWYRYDKDSAFKKVILENILTYSVAQTRLIALNSGNILTTNSGYLGLNLINTTSKTAQHYQLSTGSSSIYTLAKNSQGEVIFNGYFNAPYTLYDEKLTWDNTIDENYNPNNSISYSNPKESIPLGGSVNISKAFGSVLSKNDSYYFSGEKVRSGDGGGVGVYESDSNSLELITGFEESNVRDLVLVDNYVVAASIGDKTASPLRLSFIDTSTKRVVKTFEPTNKITKNQGRLASDGDNVYVLSTSDDNAKTYLIKYNPQTQTSLIKIYPFFSDVGGYNDNAKSSFIYNKKDGYLYATLANNIFSRIDTDTLLAEPIAKLTTDETRFNIVDESVYFIAANKLTKLNSIALKDGFENITLKNNFASLHLNTKSNSINVNYTNVNSKDIAVNIISTEKGTYLYPITTLYPTKALNGKIRFSFTLRVNSGKVKLGGADYYNTTSWQANFKEITKSTYEVGKYTIISEVLTVTDLAKINLYTLSNEEGVFDITVSDVTIENF